MRSSVSAILSGSAPEQSMSYPDYQQTPNDHQSILVVVRHVGRQLRTKQFNRAFDRISHVQRIKIVDSQNTALSRTIWIRYLRSYPVENNDWGDFQTHRKVLGLISIGQCNSQEELNELCRIHESLKVKYAWTLFDSRCILFGLNSDGSIYEGQHSSDVSPVVDSSMLDSLTTNSSPPQSMETGGSGTARPKLSRSVDSFKNLGPSLSSSMSASMDETISEEGPPIDDEEEKQITSTIKEEYASQYSDATGPASSGDDDDSSSTRSDSVTGTLQYSSLSVDHHTGDGTRKINPETGSCYSASSASSGSKSLITPSNFKATPLFYPTMELSQSLEHDIEEFVSALFWVLESKRLDKAGLRKADRSLLLSTLCAPFEKKDFVGLDLESKNNKRRAEGRLKKQLGDLTLQAGLANEAILHYNGAIEILKAVNDWLWLAGALEGICSASVCIMYPQLRRTPTMQRNSSLQPSDFTKMKQPSGSLPAGLDPSELLGITDSVAAAVKLNPNKNYCLSPLELLEKYREAVTHYGKYRQAGIIETEASIKAALVLIEQKQILHAADFLQNAVFISLQLTEEEKMQRFNALSDLYTRLGFHRKAAFFKRVAAMRCVSPSNPQPNWNLCHSLLLQVMGGYNLSLNANEPYKFGYYGWPRLQIQIMQELVGTAKRKGNSALATRHMTLLLGTMLPHLSRDEKKEFSLQLELITKESEGLPVPLVLENGLIIPPVHLLNVPTMKLFRLVPPTPHLRAEKKPDEQSSTQEQNPFFYSFLPLTNRDKINAAKDITKAEFCWVEGELCEVNVLLENPLPIELKLNSMNLITEGVNFQINSNVISIPADSIKFPVTLTGIPLAPGNLRILGYSTYALGVKSNIRLKNCQPIVAYPHVDVEIVPALPSLEIETSKPKSEFFSSFSDSIITSASVSLLMGETQECTITLTNAGKVPVESIEISLDSRIEKYTNDIFNWSQSNLLSQLPIAPGASASFTVYIYGAGDFIGQANSEYSGGAGDTNSISSMPVGNTPSLEGPSSLPSRLGAISERLRPKRNESSPSNRSSSIRSGGGSSLNSFSMRTPQPPSLSSTTKTYEAVLKLKYSGGPGFKSGHFRSCGIALNVEVAPTLYVTKWDTLPGESPSQFYLVLDVCNATQQEMELQYTKSKQILIEKGETCRIPVPIDRCSLPTVEKNPEDVANEHIVNNVDLKWSLPEASGKAVMDGIRLTQSMVQHVIVSPIQWEVTVNGESVKAEELRFDAGEMINIGIWLKNHMREELDDILLSLDCFQDYQNGKFNYRLDSRFAVIGNDAVRIPKILPGNTFQHSLSIIFFVSGYYKIDFKCNSKEMGEPGNVSDSLEQLVWKYNPPLDIQIH